MSASLAFCVSDARLFSSFKNEKRQYQHPFALGNKMYIVG